MISVWGFLWGERKHPPSTRCKSANTARRWQVFRFQELAPQMPRTEGVMRSARKLLLISGLQVQVLPGSPLFCKHLDHSAFSFLFAHCGDFCVDSNRISECAEVRQ